MVAKNSVGLWMSSFLQGPLSARPTKYSGEGNIMLYFATDIGVTFIAPVPESATIPGGPDFNGTPVWTVAGATGAVLIPDGAAYTVLAADSGRRLILPNETANATITLPAPTLGLSYEFSGSAGAADAQSYIFLLSAGLMIGGVLGMDTDAGAGSDELVPVYANGSTHIRLTVATPDAGTLLRFDANGTNWIVSGQVASAAAPVFAT